METYIHLIAIMNSLIIIKLKSTVDINFGKAGPQCAKDIWNGLIYLPFIYAIPGENDSFTQILW